MKSQQQTGFSLIGNTVDRNHEQRIIELFALSDSVLIASPFLMPNFAGFFSKVDMQKIKHFHLITRLVPHREEQINSALSLGTLMNVPEIKNRNIDCRISIDNSLHGKVYIFKKEGQYISAIISSANFTDKGFCNNHEWGVEITDVDIIGKLENALLKDVWIDIPFNVIGQIEEEAKILQSKSPIKKQYIAKSLLDSIPNSFPMCNRNVNYWLKPVGYTKHPIPEDFKAFDRDNNRMHFSKQKPNIRIGDILVCYAVEYVKMISLYKVISVPEKTTIPDDRWPWYVKVECLLPTYEEHWFDIGLNLTTVEKEYRNIYKESAITKRGGKTLGALQWGRDKINLDYNFAQYMINRMAIEQSKKGYRNEDTM
jgi:HKD family nuclease